jgi:hypothetical protein
MRWIYISMCVLASCMSGCGDPKFDRVNPYEPPAKAFCGETPQEHLRCAGPWLPDLSRLHRGAKWTVIAPNGRNVEIGYTSNRAASTPRRWVPDSVVEFTDVGRVKIFARFIQNVDCPESTLARVYEVVEAYEPAAEDPGSTAIPMDDDRIIAWASDVSNVEYGAEVDMEYRMTDRAIGPSMGNVTDVVSLGEGGVITLSFGAPISNGPGPDFAVFENAFNDRFLELAFVEVSSDGQTFVRFPSAYLGADPLGPFGEHDPELMDGLAGKYRLGFGTPFDLDALAWSPPTQAGTLDLHHITHVRLVDIPGDGRAKDSSGEPIYDPFPVRQSAGFDLAGVGVLHTAETHPCPIK